jgi:hypothetical protein
VVVEGGNVLVWLVEGRTSPLAEDCTESLVAGFAWSSASALDSGRTRANAGMKARIAPAKTPPLMIL